MDAYSQLANGVQWVLTHCTSYQIAKDLGINNRTANRYQNGESPLENMTLATAKKLYHLYLEEFSKMDRNELFSRSLAVLNQIGMRRFEKRKPSIEHKFLSQLRIKPMTTFSRAHKDVMQYVDHFDDVDLMLIDQVTSYIGQMDESTYNDEPLEEKSIIYFSKEMLSLQKILKENF